MSRGTVFSEIHIIAVILLAHAQLTDPCRQLVKIILSLASADDLADARYEAVHCRYGLSILIHLHIEGFDLIRIVRHEHRALVNLLRQITLMLGLQVTAPRYLVFKLIVVLLQNLNRLCVDHISHLIIKKKIQTVDQSLIHKGIEEVHLFRRMLQHIADKVLDHVLCQAHVIIQIRK